MCPFVGVAPFEVPDATTPREFRHLPGRCGVVKAMVSSALGSVAEGGLVAGRRQEVLAGRRGQPGRRGRQVGRPQRRRARLPLGQGHVRAAGDALQGARQNARPGLRRRRRSRSHDRGAGTAALRAAHRAVGEEDGPATREARGVATEGGAPAAAWSTAGRPAMVWEAAAWPPETGAARLGALESSLRQESPMLVPKGRDRRLYHRFPHMTRTLSIDKDQLLESPLSTFDTRSAPASRETTTRPTC